MQYKARFMYSFNVSKTKSSVFLFYRGVETFLI